MITHCQLNEMWILLVYVESEADIAFWRIILQPYETSRIRFEIKLPSNNSLY